jgi:uncharacterized protein YjbI with pentapeptide repeats
MKNTICSNFRWILAFTLIIGVTSLHGFDEAHLAKLKSTNSCRGCDLSNANLTNASLMSADLTGANLSKANLANAYLYLANLTHTNIEGANLTNAHLYGAILKGAKMTGANFSGTTWTNGTRCMHQSIGKCEH